MKIILPHSLQSNQFFPEYAMTRCRTAIASRRNFQHVYMLLTLLFCVTTYLFCIIFDESIMQTDVRCCIIVFSNSILSRLLNKFQFHLKVLLTHVKLDLPLGNNGFEVCFRILTLYFCLLCAECSALYGTACPFTTLLEGGKDLALSISSWSFVLTVVTYFTEEKCLMWYL